jgi:hypothetical protein
MSPKCHLHPVSLRRKVSASSNFGDVLCEVCNVQSFYRGADKSLARPSSRCILFDDENISFDASLVIYTNSTNIPPIMIINRIYEHKNLLSL